MRNRTIDAKSGLRSCITNTMTNRTYDLEVVKLIKQRWAGL